MAAKLVGPTGKCPNCGAVASLLDRDQLKWLTWTFFVLGSLHRSTYGAAPIIQFNEHQKGSVRFRDALASDADLLQRVLGIGFFPYGPRLWMLGYIEPLEALIDEKTRGPIIDRIVSEYPSIMLTPEELFYRVRKMPSNPTAPSEYDSPPNKFVGTGRLDDKSLPILYGSQDLEVCVHESRFVAEDELYVGSLRPTRPLRLLDLSALLDEKDVTEFKSLDLAVHMLFLAGKHSYPVSRAIAKAANATGYDGLSYPSYFSMLRTGSIPFETAFGISLRVFEQAQDYERAKIISNLALFGRPIASRDVKVVGTNRLHIQSVRYEMTFGPSDPHGDAEGVELA